MHQFPELETADDLPVIQVGNPPDCIIKPNHILPVFISNVIREWDGSAIQPIAILPLPIADDNHMYRLKITPFIHHIHGEATSPTSQIISFNLEFLSMTNQIIERFVSLNMLIEHANELTFDIWDHRIRRIRANIPDHITPCRWELGFSIRGVMVYYDRMIEK
ncbi:MAG: hypothetical protein QXQ43_03730 [Nitrososphaerota archaeon]